MPTGIDPKVDYAFKLSVLDIKARDDHGRLYNVEMQLFGSQVHRHRLLYYWAFLHGNQLREGEAYTELRETISIAIVNTVLFPEASEFHLEFSPRSSVHPDLVFSDQFAIHLLELPKFRKASDELTDPLDSWCYFLSHGDELDPENLPTLLQAPMFHRAVEVLEMLSKSDLERERYQTRLKWERDQHAFLTEALAEGRARGMEEGRAEGRAGGQQQGLTKGELIGRIQLCQQLLKTPVAAKDELLAQSPESLQMLADALEQKLGLAKP